MRYAGGGRTIVEWRDPSIDPVRDRGLDNGFFSALGEPECQLMGVEHQWAAQRGLTAPPSSYTVTGPASDPWLAAAGLAPGDVISGVVGYEWDSLVPGCFAGQVVPLMTTTLPGSDGVRHQVDMIRATAPSGGRVFAMGTMELAGALDDLDGRVPSPRVAAFVNAALRDLARPASPSQEPPVTLHAAKPAKWPELTRYTVTPPTVVPGRPSWPKTNIHFSDAARSTMMAPIPVL
jgi:hypothetical protein